jgi:hypothetical protein
MLRKIARLFVIKTRLEAFAVIYALAVGAVARGYHYMEVNIRARRLPLFFAACSGRCSWPAPRSSMRFILRAGRWKSAETPPAIAALSLTQAEPLHLRRAGS